MGIAHHHTLLTSYVNLIQMISRRLQERQRKGRLARINRVVELQVPGGRAAIGAEKCVYSTHTRKNIIPYRQTLKLA